jgi:type II secretory pathway pseudopilin PulG
VPLNRKSASRRIGSTIAEIVVSTAIVGVVITGALESIGMVYRTRRINANRLTVPGLAQELMAEVLSMAYEDPTNPGGALGLDSGETSANRSTFDDVDDFHLWNSSDVKSRAGVARAGYTGWNQQIQVAYADLTNPLTTAGSDLGLKRITVTVTSPQGVTKTLTALRAKKGLVDQPQGLDANAVTALGLALQVGSGSRAERWGSCIANPAQDAN